MCRRIVRHCGIDRRIKDNSGGQGLELREQRSAIKDQEANFASCASFSDGQIGWRKGIFVSMRTKDPFSAFLLGAAVVCATVPGWSQQSASNQDSGVKHDMKATGHDTKTAAKTTGHDTKVVAKDTGHDVKKGTTTAVDKTKHGTQKVWHKTKDTTTGAVHGGKEGAKQPDK